MKRDPRYSKQCPVCRHKDIRFSSALDGRAKLTCGRCGKWWTEGKQPGEGYKDWPTYQEQRDAEK